MVSLRRPLALLSAAALQTTGQRRIIRGAAGGLALSLTARAQTCSASSYTSKTMAQSPTASSLGYLDAQSAFDLDQELMSTPGFCLEQLMELAGLSVAEAVYHVVQERRDVQNSDKPHILVVCGPGNNGGDGLVAARHLVMFGYDATVLYPKQAKGHHFVNLVQQCQDVGVPVLTDLEALSRNLTEYTCIVDAIFGFSFKGEPREPFSTILRQMKAVKNVLTVAVDVPSGWNVDHGDVAGLGFEPDVLISLTAPKLCAKSFQGRHFVGGRFLPPKLAEKYQIAMPDYPGVAQVVEVSTSE
jgi:NAD(P)H-hydrate epimerase